MEMRQNNRLRPLAAFVLVAAVIGGSNALAKLAASQRAEMKFVATQAEVPVDGEFRRFSADVDFDPAKPGLGKVSIAIDVADVDTGSSDANELLKGKDFFDAAHFPRATFTSSSIKAAGGGTFVASGQFALKGRSLALAVPFAAHAKPAGLWFEGSVPISRRAYGVGEGEWADTGTLADQVLIKFKFLVPR